MDVVVAGLGAEEVAVPGLPGGALASGVEQALADEQPQRGVQVVADPAPAHAVADGRLHAERVQPPAGERVAGAPPEPPGLALVHPLPGVDLDGRPRLLAEPLAVHFRHDGPEVRHGVLELRLERVDEAEGPHRPLARAAALVAVAPHGREAHPSRLGRRLLQVRGTPRSTCGYARYHT